MKQQHQISDDTIHQLTDNVLLALILSSGTARYYSLEKSEEILKACDHNLKKLYSTPSQDLAARYGISISDSIRLKAAFELADRRKTTRVDEKVKISCPEEVYELFQFLASIPYEEFWIVLLNRAGCIIDRKKISEGGISSTVVDPRKIFHLAIQGLASALILVHNHPSGNTQPSQVDIEITKKIAEGGKIFEISVLDHIIVTEDGYYSFADYGQI